MPQITLITRTTPKMLIAIRPAIEDWLVLPLIIGATHREVIFTPDDEGRPMATCGFECRLQRLQLAGRHANVNGAIGVRIDQRAGIILAPCRFIRPDISGQRLFAPGAIERADNRGKGTGGFETARIAQRNRQRAMPAH